MTYPQGGVCWVILTLFICAMQEGFSRHLAGEYNVIMVVMVRYWFFAAFVLTISAKRARSDSLFPVNGS